MLHGLFKALKLGLLESNAMSEHRHLVPDRDYRSPIEGWLVNELHERVGLEPS